LIKNLRLLGLKENYCIFVGTVESYFLYIDYLLEACCFVDDIATDVQQIVITLQGPNREFWSPLDTAEDTRRDDTTE
jgi:hypothetical protein